MAQLARVGLLAEAETHAIQGVCVLEKPEDAQGAAGIRQTARRVVARGELVRLLLGASVSQ